MDTHIQHEGLSPRLAAYWLECDFSLVVKAFQNPELVPWQLWNCWTSSIYFCRSIHFVISHIYREGKCCVDGLANFGYPLWVLQVGILFLLALGMISLEIK